MNFCRGDRVIVESNLMGTIVEEWLHQEYDGSIKPYYKVYVDYFRQIKEYDEDKLQRCLIRHKYLSGAEIIWQNNAIKGDTNTYEPIPYKKYSQQEIDDYRFRRRWEYRNNLFVSEVMPILKNSKYYKPKLYTRVCNLLSRNDVCTIQEIINMKPKDMWELKYIGKVSIKYIVDTFRDYVKQNQITDEIITFEDYGV